MRAPIAPGMFLFLISLHDCCDIAIIGQVGSFLLFAFPGEVVFIFVFGSVGSIDLLWWLTRAKHDTWQWHGNDTKSKTNIHPARHESMFLIME